MASEHLKLEEVLEEYLLITWRVFYVLSKVKTATDSLNSTLYVENIPISIVYNVLFVVLKHINEELEEMFSDLINFIVRESLLFFLLRFNDIL